MASFSQVTIMFNDNSSRYNKDLVDFLNRNLEAAILKGRMRFNFKKVESNELSKVRDMGIKRLPAMKIGENLYFGVPSIIEEIRRITKHSNKFATPKTEEEVLLEYQYSEVFSNVKSINGNKVELKETEDAAEVNFSNKVNYEIQRRENLTGVKGNSHNAPPNFVNKQIERDDDYNRQMAEETYNRHNAPSTGYVQKKYAPEGAGSDANDDMMEAALIERLLN